MPAPTPTYHLASQKQPTFIIEALTAKYGSQSVIWPQIVSNQETKKIVSYVYERSYASSINAETDDRPVSHNAIPNRYLDYTRQNRLQEPKSSSQFDQASKRQFSTLHQYMCSPDHSLTAVDIDIVWLRNNQWRGIEVTGFYIPFRDLRITKHLVSKTNNRPTWQGPNGAIALYKQIEAAEDLGIRLSMVYLNTIGQQRGRYDQNGNAYAFRLTKENVLHLEEGIAPTNAWFGTVQELLTFL